MIDNRSTVEIRTYSPGAAGRLARYRQAGTAWRTDRHGSPESRVRYARNAVRFQDALRPRQAPQDREVYADSFDALPFRYVGEAAQVSRAAGSRMVENLGYYIDDDANETVRAHVLQMTGADGVARYFAAVDWSDRDGVTAWPLRTYAEPQEAARAADREAELIGEQEREYNRAWQAGAEYAEKRQEARDARAERRRLSAAMREAEKGARAAGVRIPAILCETHSAKVQDLLEASRKAYKRAVSLADDFGNDDAFKTGASDNGEAFA